jgi:hypothetical protein
MQARHAAQTYFQLSRQFAGCEVFGRDARAGQFLCVDVTSFGFHHGAQPVTQCQLVSLYIGARKARLDTMENLANKNVASRDRPKPEVQLENLRDLLNDKLQPERRDAFRALVKRWLEAGSLRKMDELWFDVSEVLKPFFVYSGTGAAWSVDLIPPQTSLPVTPEQWAVRHFAFLVFNPLRDNLRGPCPRCRDYYIKKRETKVYCSQSCGNAKSASRSNKALAKAEHKALLKSAAKFWSRWTERKHPIRSFWVAERVNAEHKWMEIKGERKPVTRTITAKWVSRNRRAIADLVLTGRYS